MARYLVTGATGFLGGHLVEALCSHGHDVIALVRGLSAVELGDGVTVRRGDILEPDSIADAAAGTDGIFHCAGLVSRKRDDAELLRRVHVEGTRNVVRAARAAGVRRVVHASTSGTVAIGEDPDHLHTEDDPTPYGLVARFPYYRAKLYAEQAALEANGDGLEVVCVNPSLLLGPGDVRGSSSEDVRLFLERRIPAVPPGGLSFVDARDAAFAMRLAMDAGEPGQRYLVGACNATMRAFFERLERVSGVRAPIVPMPRSTTLARLGGDLLERAGARFGLDLGLDPVSLEMSALFWYVDSARAERVLGWRPRDPGETLHDTVDDLRKRGVVWPREEHDP